MTHNPPAPADHSPSAPSAPSSPAGHQPPAAPPRSDQIASSPDTGTPPRRVRVGSPLTLLAVVPGLLGFEPADSIVVIGTGQPGAEVQLTLRYDLPDPAAPRAVAAVADGVVRVLTAQCITTAAAVGYGTVGAVSPVVAALRSRAAEAEIELTEMIRAQDNRYWSYVCADPDCCPPGGTPFDLSDHPVTRAFAACERRVLASRQELAASIAAVGGEQAAAMRLAVRKAERQIAARLGRMPRVSRRIGGRRLVAAVGQPMVADAIRRCRAGDALGPESAAWLTVALRELRVRDDAWARMVPEHNAAHTRLWAELTRLAPPGYVAAPASLLAFVAWQAGDGALANVALDRALADSRRYSMARLLRRALDCGAPPSVARLPMSPEQVAATYDAQEAAADAEAAGAAVAG
ncbi:MAG TPA: DUF4192 domain-containing protein [Trebonia sp.]|jgi:hypothetical protein|nr:DUF4192 domain-containing protein [Trebonia sp.]